MRVLEQPSVNGEEGLIGGDVFTRFLVDIDFPSEKLRLLELPKRPEENATTIALQTEKGDSDSTGEEAPENANQAASAKLVPSGYSGPQDRYIAPEMKSYTQVHRFGHNLLVPTSIGDAPLKLLCLTRGLLSI